MYASVCCMVVNVYVVLRTLILIVNVYGVLRTVILIVNAILFCTHTNSAVSLQNVLQKVSGVYIV